MAAVFKRYTAQCSSGCLFNIKDDPGEHIDLAADPKHAATLKQMQARALSINASVFWPDRGEADWPGECGAAEKHGNFFAPWLKTDDSSSTTEQRNVLFIAVDDLRFELGSAGGPGVAGPGCSLLEGGPCTGMHTPNFDELAARSTVFDKNYVQHAVCSCSRTSLLTSRRPDATRVWDLYSYWRDGSGNFTSMPQWFREQGFRTIGLGKVCHSAVF